MLLIGALGLQWQVDLLVQGQLDLQTEFHDSHGYTENPFSKKRKTNNKKKEIKILK